MLILTYLGVPATAKKDCDETLPTGFSADQFTCPEKPGIILQILCSIILYILLPHHMIYHICTNVLTDKGYWMEVTIDYTGNKEELLPKLVHLGTYKYIGMILNGSPIYGVIANYPEKDNYIFKEFRGPPAEHTWRGSVVSMNIVLNS